MSSVAPRALDVRPLSASRKCATVVAVFDRLEAGESFILVDDRDPSGACICLDEERPGQGRCHYLREGPPVWHVRVERRSPC